MRMIKAALFFALFAACLLTADAQDGRPNTAAQPVASKDKNWTDRHEKILKTSGKDKIEVIFLGDSLTERWGTTPAWNKSFAPMKAANFGIGGDRTEHLLWRITEGNELDGTKPKLAVLLIGTNNFGTHSADEIAEAIKAIVATLRQAKPEMKVLVLGIFPRGNRQRDPAIQIVSCEYQEKITAINTRLAKLDDGKNIAYFDIGAKFLNKDGKLLKDNMPDFLHLSAAGYEIWAGAIRDKVNELLR